MKAQELRDRLVRTVMEWDEVETVDLVGTMGGVPGLGVRTWDGDDFVIMIPLSWREKCISCGVHMPEGISITHEPDCRRPTTD